MPVHPFLGRDCRKNERLGTKTIKSANILCLRHEKVLSFEHEFDIILTIENNLGGLNR